MGNKKPMSNYIYPNGVLKNKLGITNAEKLEMQEGQLVREAEKDLPTFSLDAKGLQKIHKHLFEDIYEWAGEFRNEGISKQFHTDSIEKTRFVEPQEIEATAKKIFQNFETKNNLRNLHQEDFAKEAAKMFGEINNLHPFREGNGRTQRIFITEVGKQAGHEIDLSQVTKERMIQASIDYSQGKTKKLEEIFIEATNKEILADLKKFNNALINGFEGNRKEKLKAWHNLNVTHAHPGNTYEGKFMGKTGDSLGVQLNNSIIVFNQKDTKYLDNQNPTLEQSIKLSIPDEFGLANANRYENAEKARSGRVYTGEVIGVTETNIYQQTRLGKIIEHDIEKIKDFEPSDVGKEVKIVYGSYGKGFVDKDELEADNQKNYLRGLGD